MPKGGTRKASNGKAPPLTEEASLTSLNASMLAVVDQELRTVGSETRAKLVRDLPDLYETIRALARGITVQTSKMTAAGELREVIYTVPPLWAAVKYLTDWGKKVVGIDPAERKEVGLTQETMDFIREVVRAQGMTRPQLPEPRDGVVILGEYKEVKEKVG